MSKRVSIATPTGGTPRASSSSKRGSGSKKGSSSTPPKSPRQSTAKASVVEVAKEAEETALIKAKPQEQPEEQAAEEAKEPFSDDCERYQKDCCCCHCVEVRCALKRAAFLRTPEGKKRLEMKMHLKSFFMDINALTYARQRIENQLDDSKPSMPSSRDGYPSSITKVKRIDSHCLSVDWFIHDSDYVDHYEIYVDNRRHKRIFNSKISSTILLDVNARVSHKILMKAKPRKASGSDPNPVDLLIRDVCCGRMDRVLKGDYFCQCANQTETEKVAKQYKTNKCQTLVDFWKPSEFLYTPVCSCPGNCDCDCYAQ